ncbi:MAG: ADP-forming succinate--CoA ligase subunit beta [Actinomycetota bacterium]|nr:ADP-forming succinate--CoA ligase subunit beta [Actinomycetota bacterium]MDA3013619.1 ADP-forming succinate--CoA ligase subunit beta [Actinomycetota bacterium]
MNLFEYQGKKLYKQYDIPTPTSIFIRSQSELANQESLLFPVVVKAQVQVGGRGKAGGIKLVSSHDELKTAVNEILGMDIKGHRVESLLIEEASTIIKEYYISFTLDRSVKKYLMLLSAKGGMDIEEVAEKNPEDLIKIYISPSEGLTEETIINAIKDANLDPEFTNEIKNIILKLYNLFVAGDCDLVEVNPLAITNNGVLALDSKITLDMNAEYRHEEFNEFEADIPIPDSEAFAKSKGLNFIKLDGSVGIIGNGAGLVMSTLDVVSEHGGKAANFLDIGGGAKAETVTAALEVLESDSNVKSVLINIFGGITRCDLVAEGIVEATKGKFLKWPIIVRLDGTNSKEGLKILSQFKNEKIIISESMDEAAKLAVKESQ